MIYLTKSYSINGKIFKSNKLQGKREYRLWLPTGKANIVGTQAAANRQEILKITNQDVTGLVVNHTFSTRLKRTTSLQYSNYLRISKSYLHYVSRGWLTEALYQQRKNNLQVLLVSAQEIDPVYSVFCIQLVDYRIFRKQHNSCKIIWSITTGRVGFTQHKKKTQVAALVVRICAVWYFRRFARILRPIIFKHVINSRQINTQFSFYREFITKLYPKYKVFSLIEATPIPFGATPTRNLPRKRYRFFLSERFVAVGERLARYRVLKVGLYKIACSFR